MESCISVIIPVYNGATTIAYALDSVLSQEGVLEVLVIDDCSTDSTQDVVQDYCQKSPLIRYIKNETNSGAAFSRNQGVTLAAGTYVAFLDADDYWTEGKLKEQLQVMLEAEAVISSTARELLKSDGTATGHIIPIPERITYQDLLKHNCLSCSAILAKREVLLEFPMEHEDSHEDYITWLKIVKKYGFALGLNKPYLKYRLSNTSKSGSKFKSAKMTFKVYRYLGLSFPKSLLCFISYAWNGVKKYYCKSMFLVLLLLILLGGGVFTYQQYTLQKAVLKDPLLIGHAMGGLKDGKYSNSLEAFKTNYKKGIRVFEADFQVTSDNIMILRHDWTKQRGQKNLLKYEGYIPTYEEFMTTPLYGKYTPLSAQDLFKLMKKYDDIYIVTDTKNADPETVARDFQLLIQEAEATKATDCLDRVIVQIYNDEMYDIVNNIYPFEHWIYTIYQRGTKNFEQLCQFCVEREIEIITMNQKKYKEKFQTMVDEYQLKLYLHTTNDPEAAKEFYEKGVDGFYTDNLTSASFQ